MSMREGLYALLGIAGAVIGWHYNLQYLQQPDSGWIDWIRQCLVNPAATSALMDLTFTYLIVGTWIVLEARRLAMRRAWLCVPITVFVSLALGLALFLILRERRLRAAGPAA